MASNSYDDGNGQAKREDSANIAWPWFLSILAAILLCLEQLMIMSHNVEDNVVHRFFRLGWILLCGSLNMNLDCKLLLPSSSCPNLFVSDLNQHTTNTFALAKNKRKTRLHTHSHTNVLTNL